MLIFYNFSYPNIHTMTTPKDPDDHIIEATEAKETPETPKPHIPLQKVSRFGNQPSKFGKLPTGNNPMGKQRPGRSAARGR
jgi:hypothetical protein